MIEGAIKVLIVEDSHVARELLKHVLTVDPKISVVGFASDGAEAISMLKSLTPDVITMDIHMPGIDGFETTRRIMETQPVPIVIVSSSYNPRDVLQTFRALEAGAVAMAEKPPGLSAPTHEMLSRRLIHVVKTMSEVRVVRRWVHARKAVPGAAAAEPRGGASSEAAEIQILAIGASTGGPPVLGMILESLRKPVPLPIVIVQHISGGFVQGLADWLEQRAGLPVSVARDGERAERGRVYLAPDGCQMRVGFGGRLLCAAGEPENGVRPSVSCLFRSVASVYGKSAAGILLTGMGRDGADELKAMRDRGAITFAQDQESCVIYGMPGAAVKIGGATHVLPPDRIAATLNELVMSRNSAPGPSK